MPPLLLHHASPYLRPIFTHVNPTFYRITASSFQRCSGRERKPEPREREGGGWWATVQDQGISMVSGQLWSIRDPVVLQRRPLNSGGISSVLEAITLPFEAKCKDMQSEELVSTSVHRCFVWRAKRLRVSQFHKILTHAMACFARHVVVETGISYSGTSANWIQFIRFMIGGSYMCEFLDEKPAEIHVETGLGRKAYLLSSGANRAPRPSRRCGFCSPQSPKHGSFPWIGIHFP